MHTCVRTECMQTTYRCRKILYMYTKRVKRTSEVTYKLFNMLEITHFSVGNLNFI